MDNTDSQALMGMTGIEALRAMIAGKFAPPTIAATMGFTLVEVDEGFAAFEGEPSARVLNPMGAVHGGWALTLIDSCTGCAGHTMLPAGVGYGTVETKVNFVRPIAATTGRLRAEGRVLAYGRTLITAEGKLTDARGKLYAHGTSTCMIIRSEKSK
ncbi:MAG: PaaI family thioesterase [Hyphomonadaceae bacterium]